MKFILLGTSSYCKEEYFLLFIVSICSLSNEKISLSWYFICFCLSCASMSLFFGFSSNLPIFYFHQPNCGIRAT